MKNYQIIKRMLHLAGTLVFLCTFYFAPTMVQGSNGNFGGGNGAAENPFIVEDAADLDAIHNHLTSGSEKLYYKLVQDIDLTAYLLPGGAGYAKYDTSGWLPFGQPNGENAFSGVFNGNGHTITGLWINRPEYNNIGLFGFAEAAVITNLNVELSEIGIKGKHNVGCLAGYCENGSIVNCYVTEGTVKGIAQVGGLAGYTNGVSFKDCFADIKVLGDYETGNLVGAKE